MAAMLAGVQRGRGQDQRKKQTARGQKEDGGSACKGKSAWSGWVPEQER